MLRKSRLLCLIATLTVACDASALARKAFLGIGGSSASGGGLTVNTVVPGASGARSGLASGDVLLEVNRQTTDTMADLFRIAAALDHGQSLRMVVRRGDQDLTLTGTVTGRPQETSDHATVEYGEVAFADYRLRSILYRPHRPGPHPVVYFLQGFTCGSIDYGVQETTSQRLVNDLAASGYAVYRVEKPGVGDSVGPIACPQIGYDLEVGAFRAGYRTLSELPDMDPDRIFIFGHSLGAVTASILAPEFQPAGIATYGGVYKAWFEYMIDVSREQALRFGQTHRQVSQTAARVIPFYYDLLLSERSWDEVLDRHRPTLRSETVPVSGQRMFGRHFAFWRELSAVNQGPNWHQYEGRVLAIYGSYDIQAISRESADHLAEAINQAHPGHGHSLLIDGAEHGFSRPESWESYVAAVSGGRWNSDRALESYDPRIAAAVIDWMKR